MQSIAVASGCFEQVSQILFTAITINAINSCCFEQPREASLALRTALQAVTCNQGAFHCTPQLRGREPEVSEAAHQPSCSTVIKDWSENSRHFIINEKLTGETLNIAWSRLSPDQRRRIAKQTADYITELRKLHSPRIQSLTGETVYSTFLFLAGPTAPHGPFSSDQELWAELDKALVNVPKKAPQRLQTMMPAATPYTFTHGDLTNVNIMVDKGNLTGIIDWETGGYFPVWWEFTSASVGLGQEDKDWKTLLQEYMPQFKEANEFWLDFFSLSRYPKLDSRATAFFQKIKE
ncbi:unnamed protein product [Clonostachys rhizophaga]|uniref:Aminoglycoside phosphotransferase domain-containing protein n=1 Tax=Clonostachys rhizophaga TaxID=160324 RepID=A0A9N9VFZ0_9HYPO|nr:unnamed protein product [Clonostachys rhizophaga]